jgi:hypothetical protein
MDKMVDTVDTVDTVEDIVSYPINLNEKISFKS